MSRMPRFKSIRFLFQVVTLLAFAGCALPVVVDSQARIVRLSDVEGTVEINKNTGLGFENAFANLPIVQGTVVQTMANGRAEVEFEDGSTLRLGPRASVEFSTLGLSDSGARLSVVNLTSGMAYVNWLGSSKDQFTLNFSDQKVALDHAAHFRVDVSAQSARVAVFKGELAVESPSGTVALSKKKMATFDADDKYSVANGVIEEPLDDWDRQATAYHDEYAKNNNSPYGYGASDLGYYGSYSNVPGYGMMWQPYFTGVGWDPFADGAWGWYPGFGYMFASAYPWGWLPYRYGNWMFVPGFGWMWQPGYWNGWVTVPRYASTTLARMHAVIPPTGLVKTVAVGRGGVAPLASPSSLTIRSGSAGLGIPRGSVEHLGHLNQQVAKGGAVTLHEIAPLGGTSGAAGFGGSRGGFSGVSAAHAGSSGAGHSGGGSAGGSHR
jgi:hypothetical protein